MKFGEKGDGVMSSEAGGKGRLAPAGLAGWLASRFCNAKERLRRGHGRAPRLVVAERVTLGPRQTVALLEADGKRLVVAMSAEGAPAFFSLDERVRGVSRLESKARLSW
jgi:flagellar biogenesis protein FliO